MRITITGGAGFVGSHLCEHLLRSGHEVICLDNFYTGTKRNVAPLLANQRFKLIQCDIRDRAKLEDGFRKWKSELIYHYAASRGKKDFGIP
ncbi:SDR family NAD(P)-dependent oxidoreductase [Chloroflexota bacterium]